jgi:undecaprenyl-diphosphatase
MARARDQILCAAMQCARIESVKRSVRTFPTGFLAWLGGHELGVLLAMAGIAAGVWTFAAIADDVREGETQTFDRRVLLAMRRPADGSPLGSPSFQEAARDVSALGSATVLGLVTAIAAGFLALDGKRHMAFFLIGSVLGGTVLTHFLKDIFPRARPDLVPYAAYFSGASFPSGHSMMSAVTYLTLGALLARSQPRKALKAYFLLLAILLTAIVGVTRVYLGVHWPTDVLAGWIGGAVWALLCWSVTRWLQKRRTLEREEEHVAET